MPRKPAGPARTRSPAPRSASASPEGPREDGRWYWRADRQEDGRRPVVWSGWATRLEAEAAVLVLAALEQRVQPTGDLGTVEGLLGAWTAAVDERARRVGAHAAVGDSRGPPAARAPARGGPDRPDRSAGARAPPDAALRSGVAGSTLQRDLK